MAKIVVEMEFDFDGFDELDEGSKVDAIKEVLSSGAESTCSEIRVESIKLIGE